MLRAFGSLIRAFLILGLTPGNLAALDELPLSSRVEQLCEFDGVRNTACVSAALQCPAGPNQQTCIEEISNDLYSRYAAQNIVAKGSSSGLVPTTQARLLSTRTQMNSLGCGCSLLETELNHACACSAACEQAISQFATKAAAQATSSYNSLPVCAELGMVLQLQCPARDPMRASCLMQKLQEAKPSLKAGNHPALHAQCSALGQPDAIRDQGCRKMLGAKLAVQVDQAVGALGSWRNSLSSAVSMIALCQSSSTLAHQISTLTQGEGLNTPALPQWTGSCAWASGSLPKPAAGNSSASMAAGPEGSAEPKGGVAGSAKGSPAGLGAGGKNEATTGRGAGGTTSESEMITLRTERSKSRNQCAGTAQLAAQLQIPLCNPAQATVCTRDPQRGDLPQCTERVNQVQNADHEACVAIATPGSTLPLCKKLPTNKSAAGSAAGGFSEGAPGQGVGAGTGSGKAIGCDPLYDEGCTGTGGNTPTHFEHRCDRSIPRAFCKTWAGNNILHFERIQTPHSGDKFDRVHEGPRVRFRMTETPVHEALPGGGEGQRLLEEFAILERQRLEADVVPFIVELIAQKEFQNLYLQDGRSESLTTLGGRMRTALSCFDNGAPENVDLALWREVGQRARAKVQSAESTLIALNTQASSQSAAFRATESNEMAIAGQCMSVISTRLQLLTSKLGYDIRPPSASVRDEFNEDLSHFSEEVEEHVRGLYGDNWKTSFAANAAGALEGLAKVGTSNLLLPLGQIRRLPLSEATQRDCGGLQVFQAEKRARCQNMLREFLVLTQELNDLGGSYPALRTGLYRDGFSTAQATRFTGDAIDPRIRNYHLDLNAPVAEQANFSAPAGDGLNTCMKRFRRDPARADSELEAAGPAAVTAMRETLGDSSHQATSLQALTDLCDPATWGRRAHEVLSNPALAGKYFECGRVLYPALRKEMGDRFPTIPVPEAEQKRARAECLDTGNLSVLACELLRSWKSQENSRTAVTGGVQALGLLMDIATPLTLGVGGVGAASTRSLVIGTGFGAGFGYLIAKAPEFLAPPPTAAELRQSARVHQATCGAGATAGATCDGGWSDSIRIAETREAHSWGALLDAVVEGNADRAVRNISDSNWQEAYELVLNGWIGAKTAGALEGPPAPTVRRSISEIQVEYDLLARWMRGEARSELQLTGPELAQWIEKRSSVSDLLYQRLLRSMDEARASGANRTWASLSESTWAALKNDPNAMISLAHDALYANPKPWLPRFSDLKQAKQLAQLRLFLTEQRVKKGMYRDIPDAVWRHLLDDANAVQLLGKKNLSATTPGAAPLSAAEHSELAAAISTAERLARRDRLSPMPQHVVSPEATLAKTVETGLKDFPSARVFYTPELRSHANAAGTALIRENVSVASLPPGAYTYVLLEDGTLTFGRVREPLEIGVKHIDLAAGRPVKIAGELRVGAGGAISYNLESGSFTRTLRNSLPDAAARRAFDQQAASIIGDTFQAQAKGKNVTRVEQILLPSNQKPKLLEWVELCAGIFRNANRTLCGAVDAAHSPKVEYEGLNALADYLPKERPELRAAYSEALKSYQRDGLQPPVGGFGSSWYDLKRSETTRHAESWATATQARTNVPQAQIQQGSLKRTSGGVSGGAFEARDGAGKRVFIRFLDDTEGNGRGPRLSLAASQINQAMGLDTVPVARLGRVDGRVAVISQEAKGVTGVRSLGGLTEAAEAEMGAFEFLIGQSDGHLTNYHVETPEGATAGIGRMFDHDKAFTVGAPSGPLLEMTAGNVGALPPQRYSQRFVRALRDPDFMIHLETVAPGLSAAEREAIGFRRQILLNDLERRPSAVLGATPAPTALHVDGPAPHSLSQLSLKGRAACPECPENLRATSAGLAHSRAHYPGKVESIQQAEKFARAETGTTAFVDGTQPEDLLPLIDRAEKVQLESSAPKRLAENQPSVAYEVEFLRDTPEGPQKTKVVVAFCRHVECPDRVNGVDVPGAYKQGDIISLYPVCGPGVRIIPKLETLSKTLKKLKPGDPPFGPDTNSGVKAKPCPQ